MPYKNKADAKAYRERNKEKAKAYMRDYLLMRSYGITTADYERMADEQNRQCALCFAPESKQRYGVFHVDHDHETGRVRGLLCGICNYKVLANHSLDYFYRVIDYLKQPDVPEVTGILDVTDET